MKGLILLTTLRLLSRGLAAVINRAEADRPLPTTAPAAVEPEGQRRGLLPWWAWLSILAAPFLLVMMWWLRRRFCQAGPVCCPPDEEPVRIPDAARSQSVDLGAVSGDAGAPAPVSPTATAATAAGPAEETAPAAPDDLTLIEGIGPKLSAILQEAGITTFAALAECTPQHIQSLLRAAGHHLADPTSWPEQARLLAAGDQQGFRALTARLKGGRYVD